MKTVYTIGPISNDPDWIKKFHAVKDEYEALGFKVLSPLDHDEGLTYREYMKRSVEYVFQADYIVALSGFSTSPGAMAEWHLAKSLEIPLFSRDKAIV